MSSPPRPSGVPKIPTIPSTPAPLHIRTDPHSGRKYHASAALPADTDLLGRCSPYSYTIWKRFRNEVCAECWRYDGGRRAFLTRRDDDGLSRPSQSPSERDRLEQRTNGASVSAGLWFCDERCQSGWMSREGAEVVDLLRQLEAARQKKPKPKPKSDAKTQEAVEIAPDIVERAWDSLREKERSPKEVRRWRDVQLEDYEADMARYVLLALHRYHREQCNKSSPLVSRTEAETHSQSLPQTDAADRSEGGHQGGSEWETFASLQSNELQLLRACPEILEHQTRIYQLLKGRFGSRVAARSSAAEPSLADLVTVENVRTILGVDPGNSFGIWETPLMEESECLGFAVYPLASFFNHHCAPNVRKERDGRTLRFLTTRPVEAGEELCISYGHVETMDVKTRRQELLEGWYFECRCGRCTAEAGEGSRT
ncbi:SET domain-containing protein [Trametes sanguinea]|nr:SET domain-containing protein [Trametes sanguinea]